MNTDKDFKANIHENAKALLTSDFYWNLDDPNSPFSLNRVSNTFGDYMEWRIENKSKEILYYFPEIGENELVFDKNKTDIESIKAFYKVHYDLQKNMLTQYSNILYDTLNEKGSEAVKISNEQKLEVFEKVASNMGFTALMEHDDNIMSVGFGQFITEGVMDKELKILTEKAIQRQLLPFVLDHFENKEYMLQRKKDLTIMLQDLAKIN